MINHQILSEPASTRRLKANLSLAIDEAMLARKISGLHDQLDRIQHQPEHRARVRYMNHELVRLDHELGELRKSASDCE